MMAATFYEALFPQARVADDILQADIAGINDMALKIAQKWLSDANDTDREIFMRQIENAAMRASAGVRVWLDAWKMQYLSRFRGNCMLHDAHNTFGKEQQNSAEQEQSIQDAIAGGSAEALLPFARGLRSEDFDWSEPAEGADDIVRLRAAVHRERADATRQLDVCRDSIAALELEFKALQLESTAMQLRTERHCHSAAVSEKSAEYEAWTNPASIKAARGMKHMLRAQGVQIKDDTDCEVEFERVRKSRFEARHKAACAAAVGVLPSPAIRERIQQGMITKRDLQAVMKQMSPLLSRLQSTTREKKLESMAIVQKLHKAKDALEWQISHCKDLEDGFIAEDDAARVALDEIIDQFWEALALHCKTKATRAAAGLRVNCLQKSHERLIASIATVEAAVEAAWKEFDNCSDKAGREKAELEGSVDAIVANLDSSAGNLAQAILESSACASGYLDLAISEKSQELKDTETQLHKKKDECNEMEQAMATKQCSSAFATLIGEESQLQKSVGKCKEKLSNLQAQWSTAKGCFDSLQALGLPVEVSKAVQQADEIIASTYRSHAIDAQRKAQLPALTAPSQQLAPQSQAVDTLDIVQSTAGLAKELKAALHDPNTRREIIKALREEIEVEEQNKRDERAADNCISEERQKREEEEGKHSCPQLALLDDLSDRVSDAGSATTGEWEKVDIQLNAMGSTSECRPPMVQVG